LVANADRHRDAVLRVDHADARINLAGTEFPHAASERGHKVRSVEAVEVDQLMYPHSGLGIQVTDRVPPSNRWGRESRRERAQIEGASTLTRSAANAVRDICAASFHRESQSGRLNTELLGT
jgi:hypothetical protein